MAFEPENELERSLMQANTNPAHRPQFYRDLAASKVIVIVGGELPTDGSPAQTVSFVSIPFNGKDCVAFFTSTTRMQEFSQSTSIPGAQNQICEVKTLSLFEATKGAALVLNPSSDFGKVFLENEIAGILDGSIWKPDQLLMQKDARVLLGQPTNYPTQLTESLKALFRKSKWVNKAFLAHYHNPADGLPPHTLLGIEVSGEWDRVIGDVGVVINDSKIPDPPVDVIQIPSQGNVDEYFRTQSKPFYERKRFGLF